MNGCEEWKPILHDYLEGVLTPESAIVVQKHLGSCPGCQRLLTEWQGVHRLLQELPLLPAPLVVQRLRSAPTPLFQPAKVAALWAGLAMPGAWLLQKITPLFSWQTVLSGSGLPSLLALSQWMEQLSRWIERVVGY